MPRFDLEEALELIQTNRSPASTPYRPMVLALAKHPLVDEFDLSSLKLIFSGAAPLGAELAAEAAERVGCDGGAGLRHDRAARRSTPRHPGGLRDRVRVG